jgi:hypothetical protein
MKPTIDFTLTKSARLSKRFSIEFSLGPGGFKCEWDPDVPRKGLTNTERKRYIAARDELLREAAARLGESVLVVERE